MSTSLYSTALSPEPAGCATESEPQIIGDSIVMQRLRTQVRRLGPHFRTVLLRGEKGTGRKLVARALHRFSSHAEGPFAVFHCSSNRPERVEMRGLMRDAHRGTLYFDEIGEMTVEAQADLLSVLQGMERRRRGPILVRGLEARIIASASDDLRVLVASGRFEPELYSRIATVEIELPPLRERKEDIPLLAQHFLQRNLRRSGFPAEGISEDALTLMSEYSWQGNVQELRDVVQRAKMESGSERIEVEHIQIPEQMPRQEDEVEQSGPAKLQEVVEQHVFQVLKECAGNKVRAAEMLGISRSTLYRMLDAGLQMDRIGSMR